MLKKIWREILDNKDDYELVEYLDIAGSYRGYLYKVKSTGEVLRLGIDKLGDVNYIEFKEGV